MTTDVLNSELVLIRNDIAPAPGGFEIARGDELACWRQLEKSLERHPLGPDRLSRQHDVGRVLATSTPHAWIWARSVAVSATDRAQMPGRGALEAGATVGDLHPLEHAFWASAHRLGPP